MNAAQDNVRWLNAMEEFMARHATPELPEEDDEDEDEDESGYNTHEEVDERMP